VTRRTKKPSVPEGQSDFYEVVLDEVERPRLRAALEIDGLDEEIALLRLRLRAAVEQTPEQVGIQLDLVSAIARLVKTRHQLSGEQKKSLKAAVSKVLEEVAVPLGLGIGAGVASNLRSQTATLQLQHRDGVYLD